MDLRSYCRMLARRWLVLVSTFIVVGAALVGAGLLIPASYTANVRIAFAPNLPPDSGIETRQISAMYLESRMNTYAEVVTTNQVLQPVVDSLGLGVSVDQLVEDLAVTIPTDTTVIDVEVSASTGAKAASIANRIANEMPWGVASLETSNTVAESPVKVTMLQPAAMPESKSFPNTMLNLVVAAGLALFAAIFAAVLVDIFDTRIRSRRDVTESGTPYLGGIPKVSVARGGDQLQFSRQTPELQAVLRRIAMDVFYTIDASPAYLLVTAPQRGAGKTVVAANIAGVLAEAGKRVAFIDADARGGSLAAAADIAQAPGITDFVTGRAELDESVLQRRWESFSIIPGGESAVDVGEMLAGEKFGELMTRLADHFDVIVVDAPPITNLGDGSRFTRNIANVLVVAEATRTRRAEMDSLIGGLRHGGAKVLGVVLSRARKDEQPAPADEKGRDYEELPAR